MSWTYTTVGSWCRLLKLLNTFPSFALYIYVNVTKQVLEHTICNHNIDIIFFQKKYINLNLCFTTNYHRRVSETILTVLYNSHVLDWNFFFTQFNRWKFSNYYLISSYKTPHSEKFINIFFFITLSYFFIEKNWLNFIKQYFYYYYYNKIERSVLLNILISGFYYKI